MRLSARSWRAYHGSRHFPRLNRYDLCYTSRIVATPQATEYAAMRTFQILDGSRIDKQSDSLELFFSNADTEQPRLALRREGIYVTISASYGPLEIALRPRYEDVVRTLSRLTPVDGLHTTRQVGTAQAYLAMGITTEDNLMLRPTIVADATGHMSLNIEVTQSVRKVLYDWLKVPSPTHTR